MIDLAAVAAGFVLRAIAGGVATGVPLSDWFLIVAGAGSLFIVTGKRHAEQVELGSDSLEHRSTLGEYSTAFLGYVRAVASGVMITAYCLWAFENAAQHRRRHAGSGSRSCRSSSRCCATRSSSSRAAAAHPRRSCSPTACCRSSALVWLITFALGVHG